MLALIELVHFARPVHRAELRSAHAAESRFLVVVVRQRLVVHTASGVRIERQRKLLVPVEGIARMGDRIVPIACARTMPCDVGRMSRDLVSDNSVLYVLL